ASARKRHDVNLKSSRLVGNTGQPFAIGRKRRLDRHKLPVLHNGEGFFISASRDGPNLSAGRPIRARALVRCALFYAAAALECEIFSVGRPGAKKFRLVVMSDQCDRLSSSVGGFFVKPERAVLIR